MVKITTGDVVELKSGGPRMTVTMRALGGDWVCQWFDGERLGVAAFPPAALRLSEDAAEAACAAAAMRR